MIVHLKMDTRGIFSTTQLVFTNIKNQTTLASNSAISICAFGASTSKRNQNQKSRGVFEILLWTKIMMCSPTSYIRIKFL